LGAAGLGAAYVIGWIFYLDPKLKPLLAEPATRIVSAHAQAQSELPIPSDSEIRNTLAEHLKVERQSVGIVVGIVSPQDTVFEIGSMTKVFTSLVLMDMVQHGEVAVEDPVSKYLPPSVHVPERAGRRITLKDLSTQTSGLPRMPGNFHPKNESNPYADYTAEHLYDFISGYTLTRDIGTTYEYSNLGVGLLGIALARRAGTDYEA
jgi:CubicO group peptidase (beta-lactamase class C family)